MSEDGSESTSTRPAEASDLDRTLLNERFGPRPAREPARPKQPYRPVVRVVDSEFECAQRRRDLMDAMDDSHSQPRTKGVTAA